MTDAHAGDDAPTPLAPAGLDGSACVGLVAGLRRQWAIARRPRLESGWASLQGTGRARNQDAVTETPPLFAVADGVGGGAAGELASSELLALCREVDVRTWRDPRALSTWLAEADAVLARRLRALGTAGRSATTLAAAWVGTDGRGSVAHVGDSRVLRLRPRGRGLAAERLTRDQTYGQLGEPVPEGGHRDDPARMLGVGVAGDVPVRALCLRERDWLVLCSDGLHRHLGDDPLADACAAAGTRPLQVVAHGLAHRAQALGSRDDVSVLLVRRNPWRGARRAYWAALVAAALGGAAAAIARAVAG